MASALDTFDLSQSHPGQGERWWHSSGLSEASERVARETIRQVLPAVVIVCGLLATAGALTHILFLEAGIRVYLVPAHLLFVAVGIYWTFRRPVRLNLATALVGFYLTSIIGNYMVMGQYESAIHFSILVVGGMYLALDRRLLLVLLLGWGFWIALTCLAWLPAGQGLAMLVILLISVGGGLVLRYLRISSVEKFVALQEELQRAVHEREVALQRVRDSEKLESLGVMAAGVAHDYNNLLVGVVGGVDLATTAQDDNQRTEAFETIRSSADALLGLSRQMLEVAGGRPIEKSVVDVNALVVNTIKAVVPAYETQSRIQFQPGDVVNVRGEADSLGQVVLNLLTNAMQYGSEVDGALKIGTGMGKIGDSPAALIWIEDDGPGVPEAIQGRIFDPFFTTNDAGRGLGLATVRTIVGRHEGIINFVRLPAGSRFEVYLHAVESEIVDQRAEARWVAQAPGGRSVLLVEDDHTVREVTAKMLESLNFEVLPTASGNEALQVLARTRTRPDVAIIGVLMPGLDGFATLALLREQQPQLPALFVSGFGAAVVNSDLPPHSHFISKPFASDELSLALSRLLPPFDEAEKLRVAANTGIAS